MRNLIIGALIAAAVSFAFTKWKLHRDVEKGVDMAVLMMTPYAVVQYDGVSSTLTGELTINGIRGRVKGFQDEFFIDRLGIETPSFLSLMKLGDIKSIVTDTDDYVPEYFGLIVEGLRMPAEADYGEKLYRDNLAELGVTDAEDPAVKCTGRYSYSGQALKAMGYSEYDIDLRARFRQLGNSYAVEVETRSKDMWQAVASLTLTGNMVNEFAKGTRYRPRMDAMEIEYTDLSMRDRTVAYCKRLGLDDDEVRAAQLETFHFFGRQNGIEFDEYVAEPYEQFLNGKSTLVVTASPSDPITISQIALYKPSDVPALLRLSAEAR